MPSMLSDSLWKKLCHHAIRAKNRTVVVAYFSDSSILPFESTDYLVVDASNDAIRSGKTNAKAIQDLFKKGVHLYSHNNLHGKMFIFDDVVIVSSSNVSRSSQNKLTEIAVLIEDHSAVREARTLALTVIDRSVSINRNFLERILEIEVDTSKVAAEENSQISQYVSPKSVWILEEPPRGRSNIMRAYFIALIRIQIGDIAARKPFLLWPRANVSGHEKKGELVKVGKHYELTDIGVDYFNNKNQLPKEDLYPLFFQAVKTGRFSIRPDKLKSTKMREMPL